MKIKGRLINKNRPILIIRKDRRLKLRRYYKIRFLDNQRKDILTDYLKKFNNDFYCFTFVHKVKGALGLKYQNDYEIDIEETGKSER